jgi:hypothetical protein
VRREEKGRRRREGKEEEKRREKPGFSTTGCAARLRSKLGAAD